MFFVYVRICVYATFLKQCCTELKTLYLRQRLSSVFTKLDWTISQNYNNKLKNELSGWFYEAINELNEEDLESRAVETVELGELWC